MRERAWLVVVAATLAACAAARPRPEPAVSVALPFRVLRTPGGQEMAAGRFLAELAAARAVCVGESHASPHDHEVQQVLLEALARHAASAGRQLALGMEMFQRPFQGVLDDFTAGRIDEPTMLSRTGWSARWGFDFALYRPLLDVARGRGLPLLALNAPQEITRKVARRGLAGLSDSERATIPDLDLTQPEHLERFREATREHPLPEGGFDSFYAAQVLWDETMAQTAAEWLLQSGDRQVFIVAGTGHCIDSAVPDRLRRRGLEPVVSVRPIFEGDPQLPGLLAAPETDFLVLLPRPLGGH